MNAQYQFQQDMAYRQVLFASALVLLTMGPAKALLHRYSVLWTGLSALAGTVFYGLQKSSLAGEDAVQKLSLLRWDILIAIAAGLAVIALWDKIRRRTFVFFGINRLDAALFGALLILLLVFRKTRTWPVYLVVVFGLPGEKTLPGLGVQPLQFRLPYRDHYGDLFDPGAVRPDRASFVEAS